MTFSFDGYVFQAGICRWVGFDEPARWIAHRVLYETLNDVIPDMDIEPEPWLVTVVAERIAGWTTPWTLTSLGLIRLLRAIPCPAH